MENTQTSKIKFSESYVINEPKGMCDEKNNDEKCDLYFIKFGKEVNSLVNGLNDMRIKGKQWHNQECSMV